MLTDKQRNILDIINRLTAENGYSPSVREICTAAHLSSPATVHRYIKVLKEKGFIEQKGKNMRLVTKDNSFNTMPLIGTITAGVPIFAYENFEGYFPVPETLDKSKDYFMLNVSGNSMINAGINDRDKIIAEKTDFAENGDIVVAIIEDEATVKRYFKEKNTIRLQPENEEFKPIYSDKVKILGKVVALYRELK